MTFYNAPAPRSLRCRLGPTALLAALVRLPALATLSAVVTLLALVSLSTVVSLSALVMLSALGCGRPITPVDLAPMSFVHASVPIEGTIELCLSPKLRKRQWNVEDHPFIVELGSRTALNFEILAKSAFRKVIPSFDASCGSATRLPWLSANILSANRDWDTLWSTEQTTTITMEFELVDPIAGRVWSTTTKGEVTNPPSAYTQRKMRAAEAFGKAIEQALRQAFEELVESEAVRSAFEPEAIKANRDVRPESS